MKKAATLLKKLLVGTLLIGSLVGSAQASYYYSWHYHYGPVVPQFGHQVYNYHYVWHQNINGVSYVYHDNIHYNCWGGSCSYHYHYNYHYHY